MKKPPILIIGCPRSGTTLLRLVLDSHPNISSGPETHFLIDMASIIGRHWHRVRRFGFDKAYWHKRIADFFDSFQMEYALKRGKQRWCEKTPAYTAHLDVLDKLFPDAQYLHIIRNGLDVAASHRERWGYRRALRSAKTWTQYISLARAFGETVPPDRYMEVRYEVLVSEPEPTIRNVLDFLNEPWDPIVLDYRRVDHDRRDKEDTFMQMRRESGDDKAVIYKSRVGAGGKELNPLLRLFFKLRAGRQLRALGYS